MTLSIVSDDRLASQGLNENLHTTTKTKDEVKRRLLLDVVIRESSTILKLLPGEDEGQGEASTPSGCCNPRVFDHPHLKLLLGEDKALLVGRDAGNDDQPIAQ